MGLSRQKFHKKVPIVFTFDKRIVLAAAVAIKSMIDSAAADSAYDIHILHSDLDAKTQKAFLELDPEISFHYIDPSRFAGMAKSKSSWTEIVYYRILIPEVLPQYDKVIYSDVDVFFKRDLSGVYDTDVAGYEWAGVRAEVNSAQAVGHRYFPENKNEYIFWSGFMLINCAKWRQENTIARLFENGQIFHDRLKFFDLDLINITCDSIKPLPFDYCVLESIYEKPIEQAHEYGYLNKVYSDGELLRAKNDPAIIHYAGELGKPWWRKNPPAYYKEYTASIPKSLRRYTLRDLRKILFNWLLTIRLFCINF
jgi:lipopolysaccharide biosynthesis glycosyltransferase